MKKFLQGMMGWAVSGVFLAGLYSIGHFVLKMDDTTILILAGYLIWSEMATTINKDDAKSPTTRPTPAMEM